MWYTKTFYQNLMFRHSCSNCHYCNTNRPSDLTLADFWGWEKTNSDANKDDKGLSLVLVNTEKGRKLWEAVQKDMEVFPAKLDECIQTRMQFPTPQHAKRQEFEKDYSAKGFRYVYNKEYDKVSFIRKVINKVKRIIKSIVA